jgi:hypothetical protein
MIFFILKTSFLFRLIAVDGSIIVSSLKKINHFPQRKRFFAGKTKIPCRPARDEKVSVFVLKTGFAYSSSRASVWRTSTRFS